LIKFSQQYKLFILSLAGDVLGSFKPDPDPGFGIRNVVWHPSDMFLAVSGWDNKVSTTSIDDMNKSSLVIDLHTGAVNMD
jgi:WD40 repeat protein